MFSLGIILTLSDHGNPEGKKGRQSFESAREGRTETKQKQAREARRPSFLFGIEGPRVPLGRELAFIPTRIVDTPRVLGFSPNQSQSPDVCVVVVDGILAVW